MAALNLASRRLATERADWRRRIHNDPALLGEVLATRPAALDEVLLTDLVRWLPGVGPAKLERLGARAVGHTRRVNLLVPLGRSSTRTRQWLAGELRQMGGFYRQVSLEVAA